MKTIEDFIKKPSEAVRAMVDGLRNQSNRSDFKVDMDTFGRYQGDVCFGCAATCAVQQATGINLVGEDVYRKSNRAGIKEESLTNFEIAIDHLRKGHSHLFIHYFELPNSRKLQYFGILPLMTTKNWEYVLWRYEEYAEWLEEQGY